MQILIVDDHAVVRAGLRQILADAQTPFQIHEAGDAVEAMGVLRSQAVDLVLLDIGLPGKSGLDLLKQIKEQWKRLPVLILSMYPEDQYAVRALRNGAAGYMTKESAPDDLLDAVSHVCRGRRYISPVLAELLASELDAGNEGDPHTALSDREFQVLRLIASGKTVSQIADELALSVKTISTYRVRVLEKMGMKTNAELTHYAVTRGLLD